MKKLIKLILLILFLGVIILVSGTDGRAAEKPTQNQDVVNKVSQQFDYSQQQSNNIAPEVNVDKLRKEIITSRIDKHFLVIICLLLTMVFSLLSVLYYVKKTLHGAEDIVHASGLVLITFGTIILVIVVDTEQQLTASIGIMGAIAGYLFGTMRRGREDKIVNPQDS